MTLPCDSRDDAIERAIALAEAALRICDDHEFLFAAIDLSSALDKLKGLRDQSDKR